jgi:hypothetical protein
VTEWTHAHVFYGCGRRHATSTQPQSTLPTHMPRLSRRSHTPSYAPHVCVVV